MLWLLLSSAHAFCGSYVGPIGDVPANGSSRVVVAYDGVDTTVTMTADAKSVPREFGMLVPVPAGTTEDDVTVITDLTDLEELDIYTAPRLVAYDCYSLHGNPGGSSSSLSGGCNEEVSAGCSAAFDEGLQMALEEGLDFLEANVPGVDQLAFFTEGDLSLSVLDADTASSLQQWLDLNGYGTVDGAEELLTNYIEQDVHFLAVKATMPIVGRDAWLDPIQVVYPGEKLQGLPLRLGSLNASGDQEVTMWVIGQAKDGAAAITTFDEVVQESECMPAPGVDVVDTLEAAFDEAVGSKKGAWVTEYSWPMIQHCDPCAAGYEYPGPWVSNLGGPGASDAHVTRMRMRFDPLRLDQDLHWQYTRDDTARQLRYIEHADELEGDFPICLEGWADPPAGTCEDERTESSTSSARLPGASLLLLPLLGWAARRKRR